MKNKGNELAKVLAYYDLLRDYNSGVQKIVCPFHQDVNPSLLVNLKDGNWFCFGCNLSGTAYDFVKLVEKKYNGLNELQALQKYTKILKSNKVSDIKFSTHSKMTKKSCKDLYNEAYDYYHGLKKVNWSEISSLEEYNAKQYMEHRGFTAKTLNSCKAKVTYNDNYSLIFPMLDNGKFKGWVCRTVIKEIEAKRKYLYNTGFRRANTLVGDYGKKSYVIVTEGYMDRLKMLQCGESNVVAILGWKMSDRQIEKLKQQNIKVVISALDNDECGKKGTKFLRKHFKVVRWQYLKGIKDPGDFTQELFDKMYKKTMIKFKEEKQKWD